MSSDVELPAPPLRDMVRQSDLIITARITTKEGVLSADESTVFTDYSLVPLEVLKDQARLELRNSPGMTTPLIARQVGGHVTVDGLELSADSNLFSRAGLDLNGVYLMFLRLDTEDQRFKFVAGPYGVFKIEGTTLVPPPGDAASATRPFPMEKETLYREVVRLIRNQPD